MSFLHSRFFFFLLLFSSFSVSSFSVVHAASSRRSRSAIFPGESFHA
ncbi:BnaA06g25050D [Brassica napus]|uniref:BnaA06g25050D protein n=1 Tax=Brassica napus TaxID=3708 RepID=A0A078F6N7_BRANA|nr:BnaA06g25050D [Brassica napus]